MVKLFASVLIFIAATALITSLRSFYALHKMGRFQTTFWQSQGLKTIILYFIWCSLLIGGIGLHLQQFWGKTWTRVGLWGLLIIIFFYGILRLFGLGLLGNILTQENAEGTNGASPVDPYIRSGLTGTMIAMLIVMAILIGSIIFLEKISF